MSDVDRSDPHRDDDRGPHRQIPLDGRDLEIRLSLHVVGGDGESPVQVRWVEDGESRERKRAGASTGSPWAGRTGALSVAAIILAVLALGALTASFLRPGALASGADGSGANGAMAPPTATDAGPPAGGFGSEAGGTVAAEAQPEEEALPGEGTFTATETARFSITGDLPPGSRILINGEEVRRRTLALRPGSYDIEVRASEFAPARTSLTLSAGETRSWHARLQPLALAQAPAPIQRASRPAPVREAPAPEPEPAEPVAAEPLPVVVEVDPSIERERLARVAVTEVQATLQQLVGALERRSVDELLRIYPAMPPVEQDRWRQFLQSQDISNLRVTLTYVQTPVVRGDRAEASFDLVLQFRSSYSGAVRQPTRYGATLERGAETVADWRIRSLSAVQ